MLRWQCCKPAGRQRSIISTADHRLVDYAHGAFELRSLLRTFRLAVGSLAARRGRRSAERLPGRSKVTKYSWIETSVASQPISSLESRASCEWRWHPAIRDKVSDTPVFLLRHFYSFSSVCHQLPLKVCSLKIPIKSRNWVQHGCTALDACWQRKWTSLKESDFM